MVRLKSLVIVAGLLSVLAAWIWRAYFEPKAWIQFEEGREQVHVVFEKGEWWAKFNRYPKIEFDKSAIRAGSRSFETNQNTYVLPSGFDFFWDHKSLEKDSEASSSMSELYWGQDKIVATGTTHGAFRLGDSKYSTSDRQWVEIGIWPSPETLETGSGKEGTTFVRMVPGQRFEIPGSSLWLEVIDVRKPHSPGEGASVLIQYNESQFWVLEDFPKMDFEKRKETQHHFTLRKVFAQAAVESELGLAPWANPFYGFIFLAIGLFGLVSKERV